MIQRRCPHLKADLERFGEVDNGILTCTLHGWQFELATGTLPHRRRQEALLEEDRVGRVGGHCR